MEKTHINHKQKQIYSYTHLSLISSYLWFKEDVEHHGEPKEQDKEDQKYF